jgi:hypothetical protein
MPEPTAGQPADLLTIREAAELLRAPVATLRYWRHLGSGPHSFRLGAASSTAATTSKPGSTLSTTAGDSTDGDPRRAPRRLRSRRVDRTYWEMTTLGHRPPLIVEDGGLRVRAGMVGGHPVVPVRRSTPLSRARVDSRPLLSWYQDVWLPSPAAGSVVENAAPAHAQSPREPAVPTSGGAAHRRPHLAGGQERITSGNQA